MLLGWTFAQDVTRKRSEYVDAPEVMEAAGPALEVSAEEAMTKLPVAERMLRAAMEAIRVEFPQAFQTAVEAMRVLHEGLTPAAT